MPAIEPHPPLSPRIPLDLPHFNNVHGFTTQSLPTQTPPPDSPPIVAKQPTRAQQSNRERYAQAALRGEVAAVASCKSLRNNRLNLAAFKLFSYVAAGVLNEAEVAQQLTQAALACGLEPSEIKSTIASGRKKGLSQPRDLSHLGKGSRKAKPADSPESSTSDAEFTPDSSPVSGHSNPHRLARLFLADYLHRGMRCIRYWRDDFHVWNGSSYQPAPNAELRAQVTSFLAREFDRIYARELSESTKQQRPRPLAVTTTLVSNVIQALAGETLLAANACPSQPAWLPAEGEETGVIEWPVNEVLVARNALVHLPSFVAGKPCTQAPTPRLFSPFALDYKFTPDARPPVEWLAFLDRIWGKDAQSIATLQEWMGYLLTPDNRMQKILLMICPKRSGKGTIAKVIRAMLGPQNVTHPRLSTLAGPFGTHVLVGKLAAIIDDARVSHRTDAIAVTEQLLTISGDAAQTVPRKYLPDLTTELHARIMINSNEIPRLHDSSGSLASRLLILEMTRSFFGREDVSLFARLKPEIPQIMLWAVAGWARLYARKAFVQPKSGSCLKSLMNEMSSPMSVFISEMCELEDDSKEERAERFEIALNDLYATWKRWNIERGAEYTGNTNHFSRLLKSAAPVVQQHRGRIDGQRQTTLLRIRLRSS